MRDRANSRVADAGSLRLLGDRGQRLLAGIEALERAVEAEELSYVSVVATADSG